MRGVASLQPSMRGVASLQPSSGLSLELGGWRDATPRSSIMITLHQGRSRQGYSTMDTCSMRTLLRIKQQW